MLGLKRFIYIVTYQYDRNLQFSNLKLGDVDIFKTICTLTTSITLYILIYKLKVYFSTWLSGRNRERNSQNIAIEHKYINHHQIIYRISKIFIVYL